MNHAERIAMRYLDKDFQATVEAAKPEKDQVTGYVIAYRFTADQYRHLMGLTQDIGAIYQGGRA